LKIDSKGNGCLFEKIFDKVLSNVRPTFENGWNLQWAFEARKYKGMKEGIKGWLG
jgi:hypothetical protein